MLSDPQTILITGGTSGVGLELARQLQVKGHRLAVLARSPEKLARLIENFLRTAVSSAASRPPDRGSAA